MANNFFENFKPGDALGNLFNQPSDFKAASADTLSTEKPTPASTGDPNIAVQDSQASGFDINNSDSPIKESVFEKIQNTIDNSLMQRGNGWLEYQASRWAKNYYYRFIILEAPANAGNKRLSNKKAKAAGSFQGYKPLASFKLPINPQDIRITTPFASKLTITSDGVYEEHNGVPIKQIEFSGTMGFLPNRKASGQIDGRLTPFGQLASAIAPNAVRAVSQTISSSQNLVSSFNSLISNPLSNVPGSNKNTTEAILTGYGQYHLMRLFLEGYSMLKISNGGNKYRLALHIPKDNVTYLITPGSLTHHKSVDSPMEQRYSFNATAWSTINLFGANSPREQQGLNEFNLLKGKILDVLLNTRRTLSQFRNTLQAVKSDYSQTIAGPLNLAILALKDLGGVGKTLVDYGGELGSFVKSVSPTIILNLDAFPSLSPSVKSKAKSAQQDLLSSKNSVDNQGQLQPVTGSTSSQSTNSVPFSQQQGVNLDSSTMFEIMNSIPVSSVALTSGQLQVVNQFNDQASLLRRRDYEQLISNINDLQAALENSGLDDNKFDIDYALNDTKIHLYGLISDNSYDEQFSPDAMEYWKTKANSAGMRFEDSSSKFSVPFPLGGTLEWLAQTYLDDPTRWLEIAALNNLQEPYVDEDGFEYEFTSNGNGNQFNISSAVNLFVGQKILLSSNTQHLSSRSIVIIEKISSTNYLIQVDGDSDLSNFKVSENAKMKAYLPYTINSSSRIYIPSPLPSLVPDESTKTINFIPDTDLIRFAKVDLLLTQSGDLSISSDGTANLAFGAANLVQAARLMLLASLQSVLLHPTYGNPLEVGEVTANITPEKLKEAINSTFEGDPRFGGLESFRLDLNAPKAQLSLMTNITFNNAVLPLNFDLK